MSPSLLTQSSLFGIGIAFSPLHIGVVTLLLLGRAPLRRSFAYVLGWTLANVLAVAALMLLGSHFNMSLEHGEKEQVLIDLLGAGGLLALGLYQLTPQATIGEEGMALRLMGRLPDFSDGLLVAIGAAGALLTPENDQPSRYLCRSGDHEPLRPDGQLAVAAAADRLDRQPGGHPPGDREAGGLAATPGRTAGGGAGTVVCGVPLL
jgi:hypothetical protein